ncbi:MAG: TetR/AcrR family transcriptional regulator [Aquisalinus sp.]|nr:TetR/AcrR family transcriptional regulator [Aquisalinus sp.]
MGKVSAKIGSNIRLIQAAEAELIENNGHMEMLAVAKRADVSVGLAYHHFGSKAGLLAAVIDSFYAPLREISFGEAVPVRLDWVTREKTRVRAFIDYFYDHPFAPLVAGRLGREPEVQDIEKAHLHALLEEGARNLSQGQKQGIVSRDVTPAIVIGLLMGGLRQAIDSAVLADTRPSKEELHHQIWRFFEGGLGLTTEIETSEGGIGHERLG